MMYADRESRIHKLLNNVKEELITYILSIDDENKQQGEEHRE